MEDKLNKPWRTLPARRMRPDTARALMFVFYIAAFGTNMLLGGARQSLALIVLGYLYNDCGLADWSWASRNGINGLGFCCFASMALEASLNASLGWKDEGHRAMVKWLGMIALVVFSTVQTQDMADQEGDALRGRKSLPLAVGDGPARWMTAVPMLVWSLVCPLYWGVNILPSLVVAGLGLVIALRTLVFRDVVRDQQTFRMWNAWMGCLYMLPLLVTLG